MPTVQGRVCVTGPDISMYQPGANLPLAASAGEALFVIKATEGVGYLDPWWTRHAASAQASGRPWMPYHFARPGNDPTREADWFAQIINGTAGWFRWVLDMEQPGTGAWVLTFCDRVKQRTGRDGVIYTGAYVAYDRPAGLMQYPLWLAAYTAGYSPDPNPETMSPPPPCAPWGRDWEMWQYTSSASVPGIPGRCDHNVIDVVWLTEVTGQQPTPPAPPPPEDDMPYSPDQLRAIIIDASRVIVRDPDTGGVYILDEFGMTRSHLADGDAVIRAHVELSIRFRDDGAGGCNMPHLDVILYREDTPPAQVVSGIDTGAILTAIAAVPGETVEQIKARL